MGKYRATMNLGGHRRDEVKDYDDADPVLGRRLAAGLVVPVLAGNPRAVVEAPTVNPEPVLEGSEVVDNPVDDAPADAEVKPAPAKKRAPAKKKAEPEVVEDTAPVEESSVQTSWYVSPTQSEG